MLLVGIFTRTSENKLTKEANLVFNQMHKEDREQGIVKWGRTEMKVHFTNTYSISTICSQTRVGVDNQTNRLIRLKSLLLRSQQYNREWPGSQQYKFRDNENLEIDRINTGESFD